MIEINGLLFDVKITKKRMRNMYMRLNGNTINITAPKYVSDIEIYTFINERRKWIYETYFKSIINESTSFKYRSGSIFYIFGEEYNIEFKIGRSNVKIIDKNIILTYKEMNTEKALMYLYKKLNNKLLEKANESLNKYRGMLLDYSYNNYPVLSAKVLKSKWGACYTRENKIVISSYLIHYPLDCLDYILLHEMTHFIVPNHSKRFYSIISKYMPNYKEIEKKLK